MVRDAVGKGLRIAAKLLGDVYKRLKLDAHRAVGGALVASRASENYTAVSMGQWDCRRSMLRTNTLAAVATNVPRAIDRRAVLAGTGGRTATARLDVVAGVGALVVTAQAGEAHDRARLQRVRAKRHRARLGVVALPVAAAVAIAVAGAGLARRLAGGGRRGRAMRVAALRAVVPAPAAAALRGRLVGVVGDTAALAGVPLPVGRARGAARGRGRVGRTTVGQAARLRAPAVGS